MSRSMPTALAALAFTIALPLAAGAQEPDLLSPAACGALIEAAKAEYLDARGRLMIEGRGYDTVASTLGSLYSRLNATEREMIRVRKGEAGLTGIRRRILEEKIAHYGYWHGKYDEIEGQYARFNFNVSFLPESGPTRIVRLYWSYGTEYESRLRTFEMDLDLSRPFEPSEYRPVLAYLLAEQVTRELAPKSTAVALNPDHYARHFAGVPRECFKGALGTPVTQSDETAAARTSSGASEARETQTQGADRAL